MDTTPVHVPALDGLSKSKKRKRNRKAKNKINQKDEPQSLDQRDEKLGVPGSVKDSITPNVDMEDQLDSSSSSVADQAKLDAGFMEIHPEESSGRKKKNRKKKKKKAEEADGIHGMEFVDIDLIPNVPTAENHGPDNLQELQIMNNSDTMLNLHIPGQNHELNFVETRENAMPDTGMLEIHLEESGGKKKKKRTKKNKKAEETDGFVGMDVLDVNLISNLSTAETRAPDNLQELQAMVNSDATLNLPVSGQTHELNSVELVKSPVLDTGFVEIHPEESAGKKKKKRKKKNKKTDCVPGMVVSKVNLIPNAYTGIVEIYPEESGGKKQKKRTKKNKKAEETDLGMDVSDANLIPNVSTAENCGPDNLQELQTMVNSDSMLNLLVSGQTHEVKFVDPVKSSMLDAGFVEIHPEDSAGKTKKKRKKKKKKTDGVLGMVVSEVNLIPNVSTGKNHIPENGQEIQIVDKSDAMLNSHVSGQTHELNFVEPIKTPVLDTGVVEIYPEESAGKTKKKQKKKKKKTDGVLGMVVSKVNLIPNVSTAENHIPEKRQELHIMDNSDAMLNFHVPGQTHELNFVEAVNSPKLDTGSMKILTEENMGSEKKKRKKVKKKPGNTDNPQSMDMVDPDIYSSLNLSNEKHGLEKLDELQIRDNLDTMLNLHVSDQNIVETKKKRKKKAKNKDEQQNVNQSDNGLNLPSPSENNEQGNVGSKRERLRNAKKKAKEKEPQSMGQSDAVTNLQSDENHVVGNKGEPGKSMRTAQECDSSLTVCRPQSCDSDLSASLNRCPKRGPVVHYKKKLLVLDMNGLLADIIMGGPKDCRPDTRICGRAVFKRPFCDDFLKFCFENFEVGLWSSRSKYVLTFALTLQNLRLLHYNPSSTCHNESEDARPSFSPQDMSRCTQTGFKTLDNKHKPLVCKELRKIWESVDPNHRRRKGDFNESNTLLLDDSPYKALLNPLHTAIFPNSYHYDDENDNSLGPGGDLREYLQGILACENVQKYVEQHPFGQGGINETNLSWSFYSKVLQSLSAQSSVPLVSGSQLACG